MITLFDAEQLAMLQPTATRQQPAPTATASPITLTPVGLEITGEIEFEQWREIARNFGNALRSAAFCIGDWLVYGETKWGRQLALAPEIGLDAPRGKIFSEAYDEAVALTGLDITTLQTYASVCRSIPINERDPRLSFEHHKALAPLPALARPKWLALVSRQPRPVSVRKLRASIRISGGDAPRLATSDELMNRPAGAGHENYIPHLSRLLTVLRRTIPAMDDEQRAALREDMQPLVDLVDAL